MADKTDEGFAWQVGVWDQMAGIYQQEIDPRFGPVIEYVLRRANLKSGETILDLGTGTGSVASLGVPGISTSSFSAIATE